MTHGDDSGLILPPTSRRWQVVIVPIPRGNWKETVLPKCERIRDELIGGRHSRPLDADESQTPGWKFAEYEMRGVPLRLEIGPKDIEKSAVFAARRDTREKQSLPMDGLADRIQRAARRDSGRRSSTRARHLSRRAHEPHRLATTSSSRSWTAAPAS